MPDIASPADHSILNAFSARWRWAKAVGASTACRRWLARAAECAARSYERAAANAGVLAVTPRRIGLSTNIERVLATPRPALLLSAEEFDGVAAQLKAQHPTHVECCIERATEVLNGRFDILGYGPLDFGTPVDWSLDPVGKHRFTPKYWRDYDVMRPPPGADVKVPWELSRFHYLATLGLAYRLTKDDRFARGALELLEAWLDKNPPAMTINWACPMDVAIRAVNWCFAWQLLDGSPALSDPLRTRWLCSMVDHGNFLRRNLERHDFWDENFAHRRCNNNHYLADLLGLLTLGVFWPDVKPLARNVDWARSELLAELECQILPDGVNWERAAGYQKLDVEMFLIAHALCERSARPWPQPPRARLLKASAALAAMTRPDGQLHLFGDHDDGHILDIGLSPSSPPIDREPVFEGNSYVSLRRTNSFVGMTLGGVGMLGFSGHSHNDALAVEVFLCGRPIFTDAGAYVYTANPAEHNRHRSTRAHNTIVIDGEEQNPFPGDAALIFAYDTDLAKPKLIESRDSIERDGGSYALASAATEAYARLGVEIQRTVLLAHDESRVLIEDVINALTPRSAEFRFLLEPGLEPALDANGVQINDARSEAVARLTASADTAVIHWETERFFRSRRYGHREPAWMLVGRARVRGEFKARFVLERADEASPGTK